MLGSSTTSRIGSPKTSDIRNLVSVITIVKLNREYDDFIENNDTIKLALPAPDSGKGH